MPSFFSATKENALTASAFAAAGLDYSAFIKSGNVNFLKDALAKAGTDAAAAAPAADTSAAETIAEAVKENGKLSAQVGELTGKLAKSDAIVGAVHGFLGAQPATAEDTTKALKAKVTSAATNIVAGAGHPGVDETVAAAGATTDKKKSTEGLKGAALFRATVKLPTK